MSQTTLSQETWLRDQPVTLLDLLDRLLDKGVVADGEILLTVADIDLVYVGLKCILSSVETLQKNSKLSPEKFGDSRTRPSNENEFPPFKEASRADDLGQKGEPAPYPLQGSTQKERSQTSAREGIEAVKKEPVLEKENSFFESAQAKPSAPTSSHEPRAKINVDPEKVEKGLVKLVLTVVELLRKLMERQAIRRMEGGSLGEKKVAQLGEAFLRLDEKMGELKKFFGLKDDELNLSLGPLGNLM